MKEFCKEKCQLSHVTATLKFLWPETGQYLRANAIQNMSLRTRKNPKYSIPLAIGWVNFMGIKLLWSSIILFILLRFHNIFLKIGYSVVKNYLVKSQQYKSSNSNSYGERFYFCTAQVGNATGYLVSAFCHPRIFFWL